MSVNLFSFCVPASSVSLYHHHIYSFVLLINWEQSSLHSSDSGHFMLKDIFFFIDLNVYSRTKQTTELKCWCYLQEVGVWGPWVAPQQRQLLQEQLALHKQDVNCFWNTSNRDLINIQNIFPHSDISTFNFSELSRLDFKFGSGKD